MQFLNRNDEMRRLDAAFSRPAAFAVLWGRRRVGKSRLLIEWSRRHGGLYTVADQSAPPVQRRWRSVFPALQTWSIRIGARPPGNTTAILAAAPAAP